MARSFHISPSQAHLKWNNSLAPALRVPSGADVSFDLKDGLNNQIRPDNIATGLSTFEFALADPAFGPVYVEGAEPGDILKVEIHSLTIANYGTTAIFKGFGLLADEFSEQHVKLWDLSEASLRAGTHGQRGPCVIGIAPAEKGDISTIPPYALSGGNVDTRYLSTEGSTVYFPVQVPGALFSCGDGHAFQGDGEVCGTACETPMKASLRLSVVKKGAEGWMELKCPHFTTSPRVGEVAEDDVKGTYAALGIHADPKEAARIALRGLMDWLEKVKGLTRVEGYMLASVAASLKMTQVVDMPNFSVSCSIPLNTFDQ